MSAQPKFLLGFYSPLIRSSADTEGACPVYLHGGWVIAALNYNRKLLTRARLKNSMWQWVCVYTYVRNTYQEILKTNHIQSVGGIYSANCSAITDVMWYLRVDARFPLDPWSQCWPGSCWGGVPDEFILPLNIEIGGTGGAWSQSVWCKCLGCLDPWLVLHWQYFFHALPYVTSRLGKSRRVLSTSVRYVFISWLASDMYAIHSALLARLIRSCLPDTAPICKWTQNEAHRW